MINGFGLLNILRDGYRHWSGGQEVRAKAFLPRGDTHIALQRRNWENSVHFGPYDLGSTPEIGQSYIFL